MKIYLFCPETGIYQGEDFADELPMCPGRDAIPPQATSIAPPPYRRGEVPVFRVSENKWELQPIAAPVAQGGTVSCARPHRLLKQSAGVLR